MLPRERARCDDGRAPEPWRTRQSKQGGRRCDGSPKQDETRRDERVARPGPHHERCNQEGEPDQRAGSGKHGIGSGKKSGDAHAYPEPTIDFQGSSAAGYRAIQVALDHGLPVRELRRVWRIHNGELVGPIWSMTFRDFNKHHPKT